MVSRNLNINWYTNVRADFLVKQGEEFLRKLEKAGCKMLTFGAESGTQRIMDMIDKNGDIADLYTIDKMIKKTKIIPHFCTIRGFPTEKKEEVKNTYLLRCFRQYKRWPHFPVYLRDFWLAIPTALIRIYRLYW